MVSDLDALARAAAAWVVTFTVHGFIVCLAALACGQWLLRRAASRDLLWKGALILPLATSLVTVSPPTVPLADIVRRVSPMAVRPPQVTVTLTRGAGKVRRERRVRDVVASSLATFILTTALVNAMIGGARHRRRRRDLQRELSVTWPTSVAPHIEATLKADLPGVRLVAGPRLLSPLAMGQRTVYVPAVSFRTLNDVQQTGVLAHEVAHLKRLDPYWIGFAEWLAAIVPFSYVLRFVVVRMRRDSELLCDAAAARVSRSPQSLVEALAVFVGDLEAAQRTPLRVGYADSPVLHRARRLLHGPLESARPENWVWAVLIAIAVLAAVTPRARLTSTLGPPAGRDTVASTVGRVSPRVMRAPVPSRRVSAAGRRKASVRFAGTGRTWRTRCCSRPYTRTLRCHAGSLPARGARAVTARRSGEHGFDRRNRDDRTRAGDPRKRSRS